MVGWAVCFNGRRVKRWLITGGRRHHIHPISRSALAAVCVHRILACYMMRVTRPIRGRHS